MSWKDVNKGQKFGEIVDSPKLGCSSTAKGGERNGIEKLRLPASKACLLLLHIGGLCRKLTAFEGWGTLQGRKNLSAQLILQGWDHSI